MKKVESPLTPSLNPSSNVRCPTLSCRSPPPLSLSLKATGLGPAPKLPNQFSDASAGQKRVESRLKVVKVAVKELLARVAVFERELPFLPHIPEAVLCRNGGGGERDACALSHANGFGDGGGGGSGSGGCGFDGCGGGGGAGRTIDIALPAGRCWACGMDWKRGRWQQRF